MPPGPSENVFNEVVSYSPYTVFTVSSNTLLLQCNNRIIPMEALCKISPKTVMQTVANNRLVPLSCRKVGISSFEIFF